jgi:hypothetical protein
MGVSALVKGWVFFWEDCYYYVGAFDAPTARQCLRTKHQHVAQHARVPQEVAEEVVREMQLEDGTIRVSKVPRFRSHA